MNIKVTNCTDISLRKEIKKVSEFVMEYFFKGSKMLTNVCLNIKIDNNETKQNNAWGLCTWIDNRHKPRKFLIELSTEQTKKNFFLTLIHELVHVKQYLTGEMKDYMSGEAKWKKTFYKKLETVSDHTSLPWEKQAYKLSEKLYTFYFQDS